MLLTGQNEMRTPDMNNDSAKPFSVLSPCHIGSWTPLRSTRCASVVQESLRLRTMAIIALAILCTRTLPTMAQSSRGFTRLFDGKTLDGWRLVGGVGPGYVVRDGILICPFVCSGKPTTEKEYSDFIFRCDFKVDKAGNN